MTQFAVAALLKAHPQATVRCDFELPYQTGIVRRPKRHFRSRVTADHRFRNLRPYQPLLRQLFPAERGFDLLQVRQQSVMFGLQMPHA